MGNIEKIFEYYNIEEDDSNRLTLESNGKKKILPPPYTEKEIYITFDKEVDKDNKEEIEKLVSNNDIIKISVVDLYRYYYKWNEEDECKAIHGFGLKTYNYLEKVKKSLGYINYDCTDKFRELPCIKKLEVWWNTSEVEVAKLDNGHYLVQFMMQINIDDFQVISYEFTKMPDDEAIATIYELNGFEIDFRLNRINKETFTCWECGRKMHWIDVKGNFREKLEALKECYCGEC